MSDNMMPELTLNPTEAAQEAVPELTLTPEAPTAPEAEKRKSSLSRSMRACSPSRRELLSTSL